MVFKKKEPEAIKVEELPKDEAPFNPPNLEKTESHCVNEGCYEPRAISQVVCLKHQRAS